MRAVVAALAAVVGLAGVAGCGSDDSGDGSSKSAASDVATAVVSTDQVKAAIADGAVVIDVRTPEEFAAGHLDGARNIDSAAADFDAQFDALNPDATFVIYCASGNRAGQVIARLADAGFTNLINGGGYTDLAAALGQS